MELGDRKGRRSRRWRRGALRPAASCAFKVSISLASSRCSRRPPALAPSVPGGPGPSLRTAEGARPLHGAGPARWWCVRAHIFERIPQQPRQASHLLAAAIE